MYMAVGYITRPHGLKGAVHLYAPGETLVDIDVPLEVHLVRFDGQRLEVDTFAELPANSKPATITYLQPNKNSNFLCEFDHIDDRNQSEFAAGLTVLLEINEANFPAAEDEVFGFQLIGLKLVDAKTEKELAVVMNVLDFGAQLTLEVQVMAGVVNPIVKATSKKAKYKETLATEVKAAPEAEPESEDSENEFDGDDGQYLKDAQKNEVSDIYLIPLIPQYIQEIQLDTKRILINHFDHFANLA